MCRSPAAAGRRAPERRIAVVVVARYRSAPEKASKFTVAFPTLLKTNDWTTVGDPLTYV
jgi:hypothetical protein